MTVFITIDIISVHRGLAVTGGLMVIEFGNRNMRIGLVADTHIGSDHEDLYPQVFQALEGVDLILHAGDIYVASVLDKLEAVAPVLAARGNGDYGLPPESRLQDTHVVVVAGLRIGVVHYLPDPEIPPHLTLERVSHSYFGGPVDIIVFGDSHVVQVEERRGTLLVNPGSTTFPNNLNRQPGTLGILEIQDSRPHVRIISLATMKEIMPPTARRYV